MKKGNGLMALGIIHKAMLAGQILLAAVFFFLIFTNKTVPSMAEQDRVFQLIAVTLAMAGVFIGVAIFKNKIQLIRSNDDEAAEKFAVYRVAYIIQWALLEFACIFSLISFFVIGNYAFLAMAGFLIIYFGLLAPSKNKAIIHLNLSEEEVDAL